MKFTELDPAALSDATIFLDVDGTLVADKQEILDPEAAALVRRLAEVSDVYLSSNGETTRVSKIAESLGVSALPSLRKPLKHKAVTSLQRRERTVVIGDKFLTDGLFAMRLDAEFVMVERLRASTDDVWSRTAYLVDAVAAKTVAFLSLMRPHQWVKNLLVLAPLFFGHALFVSFKLEHALIAVAAFCIGASGVYVFNDIRDRKKDCHHPRKKFRPIASGRVSVPEAFSLILVLTFIEAILLISLPALAPVMLIYIVTNILYTLHLKCVPVVDVLMVAAFYIMRLVAGSVATSIPLSPWIILCVFFVSLFVIIGKRRAEFAHAFRRKVLTMYSQAALDSMLTLSAGLSIICYALYTVLGRGEPHLIYSTLFVALALLRVLHDIYAPESRAETPERLLFKDPWILGSFIAWALYVFIVFYVG